MYESSAGKNSPSLTVFRGPYINLTFQDGPIPEHGENGTTNEEVIRLLIERIESLNRGFPHSPSLYYNDQALFHLREALDYLEKRARERQARGVEGTMQP